jgi:hypothetical protein
MKASKHEDDNLFKDPSKQYQKETITVNITLLDYFLDLIDKSLKPEHMSKMVGVLYQAEIKFFHCF